ncbi:hypothetical protein BpHYR1_001047 [Brachionus plicatilis]|uniref:Uncharacterized protein n=1 Tax=Brachionus plicatilis TaxID=10195 RepID=A0A3M7QCM9_BRAPC|nr:hypothetical protein BpHYR1_001047 [Brachionus plicatilis]
MDDAKWSLKEKLADIGEKRFLKCIKCDNRLCLFSSKLAHLKEVDNNFLSILLQPQLLIKLLIPLLMALELSMKFFTSILTRASKGSRLEIVSSKFCGVARLSLNIVVIAGFCTICSSFLLFFGTFINGNMLYCISDKTVASNSKFIVIRVSAFILMAFCIFNCSLSMIH